MSKLKDTSSLSEYEFIDELKSNAAKDYAKFGELANKIIAKYYFSVLKEQAKAIIYLGFGKSSLEVIKFNSRINKFIVDFSRYNEYILQQQILRGKRSKLMNEK